VKKALLIVGSPGKEQSLSNSLGQYLLTSLAEKGVQSDKICVYANDFCSEDLLLKIQQASIIILAFPLYVDSLPYGLTETLEYLGENRDKIAKEKVLMAIVNCGFPEAEHNKTALAICHSFARAFGFSWAGGLSLGMGGALGRKPLNQLGGLVKKIKKALTLTAEALASDKPLPKEAIDLMARPLMPKWLYILGASFSFKSKARKHGVKV